MSSHVKVTLFSLREQHQEGNISQSMLFPDSNIIYVIHGIRQALLDNEPQGNLLGRKQYAAHVVITLAS